VMIANTQTNLLVHLALHQSHIARTSNRPLTWLNRKLGGLKGY
jgi:hypothetical protein